MAAIQVTGLLGTNNSAAPFGVALDGSQNAYVTYGSGSAAGLAQLGISGTLNFNNFGEVEPNVPLEADAQLFNLGNTPLTLAALSGDTVAGTSAADYTVGAATLNSRHAAPPRIPSRELPAISV